MKIREGHLFAKELVDWRLGMNDKKFAFIICVNNEIYFEECRYYIDRLYVPEGYEVDVLAIREANSMCAAYNLGMRSTDAKYKIYLHQDVMIREPLFLKYILEQFQERPEVGMMGMIGGTYIPSSGIAFEAWNEGKLDVREPDMAYYMYTNKRYHDVLVEAIDGLMMITQYDVSWREDLFFDFDFYDISQSCEFREQGYEVLVPYQETPWVIHDSGFAKLGHYDKNRRKFLENYEKYISKEKDSQLVYDEEWENLSRQLEQQLKAMMVTGEWDAVAQVINAYHEKNYKSSGLEVLAVMSEIYQMEQAMGRTKSFFAGASDYRQMYEKYMWVRFQLIRMELDLPREEFCQMEEMIRNDEVSYEAVSVIMLHSIVDKKAFLNRLMKIYQDIGRGECCEKIRILLENVTKLGLPISYSKGI